MTEKVPANELNDYFKALRGLDPKDTGKQVLYLEGEYEISETLDCTKKLGVTIFGNHSRIIATKDLPVGNPMLDCCGTFNSTFYDLRLETAPESKPAAGLVIGRYAKPDEGEKCPPGGPWYDKKCPFGPLDISKEPPPYYCSSVQSSGGGCLFSNIHIKGKYGYSPYYNCGGEGHTFINSLFRSKNEQPAYVDTCIDFAALTGMQCINVSNVDKYFYACVFSNGVTDPIGEGVQLVNLYRSQQNISFRDCYFHVGPHPNSTVIDLTQGGDDGQTFNLLIDGGRVERGPIAPSPKPPSPIPMKQELTPKPTVQLVYFPNDVRFLRISRKCWDARIVGLRYCIESDYVISLEGKAYLDNPRLSISIPNPLKTQLIYPFDFTFAPKWAKPGEDVQIKMSQPNQGVMVCFNGSPLPKKTLPDGKTIIVTVPGNANSGYFELKYGKTRYRSSEQLIVIK
jgi:hypothetical protein